MCFFKHMVRVFRLRKYKRLKNEYRDAIFQMLDKLRDVIYLTDEKGILIYVTPSVTDLIGYTTDQVIGSHFESVILPEYIPQMRKHFQDTLAGICVPVEFQVVHKKGGIHTVSAFSRVSGMPGHRIVSGILTDVTLQKKTQDALRASEQKFKSIFEYTNNGIYQTEDGVFTEVNPVFCEMFGYSREELIGRESWMLAKPEMRDSVRDLFMKKAMVQDFSPAEVECLRKDGTEIIAEIRISTPVNDRRVFGNVRDVTENRRQEKELLAMNETLEKRVAEAVAELKTHEELMIQQTRFSAMRELLMQIAHYWRNPLNTVGLILQSLQNSDECTPEKRQEMRDRIDRGLSVLLDLSMSIDHFARFFQSERVSHIFHPADTIREVKRLVRPLLDEYAVAILLHLDDTVECRNDPNALAETLMHLIQNSCEVFRERGVKDSKIEIRCYRDKDLISVDLEDNAGGIDPEILPDLFSPYFGKRKDRPGVGLYHSKTMIEKGMKGNLTVRNGEAGALFHIEWRLL